MASITAESVRIGEPAALRVWVDQCVIRDCSSEKLYCP